MSYAFDMVKSYLYDQELPGAYIARSWLLPVAVNQCQVRTMASETAVKPELTCMVQITRLA